MRDIQNGIAAVITKEKLFNHRVVLGGFIILASAFASYMTMATYVPSLVHAQDSEAVAEKRDNRSIFAGDEGSRGEGGDEAGSHGASGTSDGSEGGASGPEDRSRNADAGSKDDQRSGPDASSSSSDVSSIATAPSGVSSGSSTHDYSYTGERKTRSDYSRPSVSTQRTSQFHASGCSKRGTTTVRHQGQSTRWNNYGEYSYSPNSRNECVKSIQRKLRQCNNLGVDGYYGSATKKAVQNYQRKMRNKGVTVNGSGVHVDGITGVQTFALMQHFSGC